MRLRAGFGLACLSLAGCQHLPDGVIVDLDNKVVKVGPCRCDLPVEKPTPAAEPAPAPAPVPAPAPDEGDEPEG